MKHVFFSFGVAAGCILAFLTVSVHGETFLRDGPNALNITCQPVFQNEGDPTLHGYAAFRIDIENNTPDQHVITLSMPGDGYYRAGQLQRMSRTAAVGPNGRVQISMWQPALYMDTNAMSVTIDGRREKSGLSVRDSNHGGSSSYSYRYGYHSSSTGDAGTILTTYSSSRLLPEQNDSAKPQYKVIASNTDFKMWPTDWLAYSRFDAVLIRVYELQGLAVEAQTALFRWVDSGGCLIVDGKWSPPEEWSGPSNDIGGATITYRGLGVFLAVPPGEERRQMTTLALTVADQLEASRQPYKEIYHYTPMSANSKFPVVENLSIPVQGMFILMIVFALVIGPLNFFILAKKKRKIWILWTVPAIAFVTSMAVFFYALFAEGFSGRTRTDSFTVLDQRSMTASTVGWEAFYAPLAPGSGLHYSYDTEVTPQLSDDDPWDNDNGPTNLTLDWTTDQHLASGWMLSRTPLHVRLRQSKVNVRHRLNITKKGASLVVQNSLGEDVQQLWLMDSQGTVYKSAEVIPAGGEVTLSPTMIAESAVKPDPAAIRTKIWTTNWITSDIVRPSSYPAVYLRPNTYMAFLDSSPFLDEGLRVSRHDDKAIIFGVYQEVSHEN